LLVFRVKTPLNKAVRLYSNQWNRIISEKHPVMADYFQEIKDTLKDPDMVRLSKWDKSVQLYYKRLVKHFLCVVVKIENSTGFVITTYLTNKIKVGEELWRK